MDVIVDLASGLTGSFGIAALLLTIAAMAILALPWRSTQVRDMVRAYDSLSTLSGGFARTRLQAVRRGMTRATQLGRRPAVLTRTLS